MGSYYIGLSLLSNMPFHEVKQHRVKQRELSSAEGRRILLLMGGESFSGDNIAKDENGRPYLPGSEADFSISHSGALTAVSMVTGRQLKTAIDVELVKSRPNMARIAEEFFSPAENKFVFSEREKSEKRFYLIWTLKECYLKLNGLSVFEMLCAPSFICDKGDGEGSARFVFESLNPPNYSYYVYELGCKNELYIMTSVMQAEGARPEIRWYSHLSLPAKRIAEINAVLSPAETVSPKK